MITKLNLELLKQKNICDADIEDLKDITYVVIDRSKSIAERIASFLEQIGNPYLFKVGNTPVKVSFSPNALTFQKSLEKLLSRTI